MKLDKLLKNIEIQEKVNYSNIEIAGITDNTKEIKNDFVFIAKQGAKTDSHIFIDDAIKAGASVIIHSKQIEKKENIIYLKILETVVNFVIIQLCKNYYDNPAKKLNIIGITGTNGKTTTAILTKNILKKAGYKCLLIGTICAYLGNKKIAIENTTPGPFVLYKLFKQAVDAGIKFVVMEVSSHSINQNRLDLSEIDIAVYTNLTQDHLDYHKTMEEYASVKARLFSGMNENGAAVINIDDEYSNLMLNAATNKKVLKYGLAEESDIKFKSIECSVEANKFEISSAGKTITVVSKLIGKHNIYNISAVYGVARLLKIDDEIFIKAIKKSKKIDGRLDKVKNNLGLNIFVDYAHTPDALNNVLNALNDLRNGKNKIITVFGCGGNRDALKRPLMGKIAVEKSDLAIVTSDNPRNEEPQKIIDDILKGCVDYKNFVVESDRRQAIKKSIETANSGDIILIAGKGHETYQILGDKIIDFDDRKVVGEIVG